VRVPVSWLAERLDLPESDDTRPLADRFADAFVRVGLEVEEVEPVGRLTGPIVVGRVRQVEELTEFKKPIRYCQVQVLEDDSAEHAVRGIVCGARNFVEGDLVVVALPGAVLPGDFAIAARKTYGHASDGMICSAQELGLGDDHSGIMVLPSGTAVPGQDAVALLEIADTVIDLSITPDRGYCFSVRGLVRELACALEAGFLDPAAIELPAGEGEAWPVRIDDAAGCPRFVARRVTGVDPTAPTPWQIRRRLMLAGIRSISLAVDITNYVMLETGQPLHAYDANKLTGAISVRRAETGEKLTTLDDVQRELDPDDLLICDDSGPIGLAGVMGGASTEVGDATTDIVIEAAHFAPTSIARSARRHKLPSEASRRFERYVDPAVSIAAAELAARLLQRFGDGSILPGRTDVGQVVRPEPVTMRMDQPDRVAGVRYDRGVTARRLQQIGCTVEVGTTEDGVPLVSARPPTWRADLRQPADLVEEVLRLEGYQTIPSVLPAAPPGRGLTLEQRRRRTVARALAEAGYVEVLPFPFLDPGVLDTLGLPADDPRRRTVAVLNPLDADAGHLASTLLPGLLDVVARNASRGFRDLALFHIGQVVLGDEAQAPVPEVGVAQRPSDAELASLYAALPKQPRHLGAVLAGQREPAGWWGKGVPAGWADAVELARSVAAVYGIGLTVQAAEHAPWHPGRCAELRLGETVLGYAGELHPKVLEELGLPKRVCALELDLDAIPLVEPLPAPTVSAYPPVLLDVAVVLDASVPVAEVTETLRAGSGELLEHLALFDVYAGEQVGAGKHSLAYALRFRAPDRTLTVEEATTAKDAAVAQLTERFGATLRA
jgi:phenylalanyl-tRNA synthetase beta chain